MEPDYTKAKMPLRDCVAELSGDKEYAYTTQKITSVPHLAPHLRTKDALLCYNNFYKQELADIVLAITGEGRVIRGNNIQDFDMEDFYNPEWF